ncbi:MAG: SelT/SelW/SelH family protein [Chloroflexi bacterium]|jgi:selenoprotein W-related protein|nr:SelT/SelW/SelH family protein [Chloroflexota bacterium]
MAALLRQFEADIQAITLVPSDSGKFEVSVDGRLIFSKLKNGRHTDPDEIIAMIK